LKNLKRNKLNQSRISSTTHLVLDSLELLKFKKTEEVNQLKNKNRRLWLQIIQNHFLIETNSLVNSTKREKKKLKRNLRKILGLRTKLKQQLENTKKRVKLLLFHLKNLLTFLEKQR